MGTSGGSQGTREADGAEGGLKSDSGCLRIRARSRVRWGRIQAPCAKLCTAGIVSGGTVNSPEDNAISAEGITRVWRGERERERGRERERERERERSTKWRERMGEMGKR